MEQTTKLKLQVEAMWWIVTLIVAYAVTYPINSYMAEQAFLYENYLFVIIFITYTRYIFLLKHTFLAYLQPLKVILIFASIPLVFYLVELISGFQNFVDNKGLESYNAFFIEGISESKRDEISSYLSREIIFFGVSSIVVAVLMPFRMLISFWRVYNKKERV